MTANVEVRGDGIRDSILVFFLVTCLIVGLKMEIRCAVCQLSYIRIDEQTDTEHGPERPKHLDGNV